MSKFMERFSLLPQGLRYKLLIAFSLMSIIPLLVIGYLVNTVILLNEVPSLGQVSIIVLLCVIIAWLGLFLAKRIIERVIDVALETKIIMDGNYNRKVFVDTGDEIGQIGAAVNFLTKKIRSNITDLKDYQDKMKEINTDIQKKVSILSNLLQIGEFISSSVKLETVLDLILSKISQLYESGFAGLYLSEVRGEPLTLRASSNIEKGAPLVSQIEGGKGFLGKTLIKRKHDILDASSKFSTTEQNFRLKYKCENIIAYPMFLSKEIRAILIAGSNIKNFTYTSDDLEIIKVFVEQASIAIENDLLMKKAEKLQIKDELTGLFNEGYMTGRLREEIERSKLCQRPCSFILLEIDDFGKYEERKGAPQAEEALRKIAGTMNEFSAPLGKPGLMARGTFALILPEVNKKGALEIAEKARKRIEKLALSSEKTDTVTASGGVSENPLDGASMEEILKKAKDALGEAKKKGKNKIVVAGT